MEVDSTAMQQPGLLVAIVGGSGSGKTWLAELLLMALGRRAVRLSQDDFYLDRSHLTPPQRARLNFDNPSAIDWEYLEEVLQLLRQGRPASIPNYDFPTHCRKPVARELKPRPVVLIDGLWLLRRRSLRALFGLSIFLECPSRERLSRRLARDVASRGRTEASVREQFRCTVEPMHKRFVAPQKKLADVVLENEKHEDSVRGLVARIELLLIAQRRSGRIGVAPRP